MTPSPGLLAQSSSLLTKRTLFGRPYHHRVGCDARNR